MTNELVLDQGNTTPGIPLKSLAPSDHEIMVYQSMASYAVTSKMYKGVGDTAGILMIMLSARELGIPPMQALNGGINIIQGKVEISARMMSALIRKAGHQISVKESTDSHCVLVGKRCDTGETLTASFSVAEAQKAGLVKPAGGWVKWPKDMCFARALSRLARQLFSDVIGMGYVEGEIGQLVVRESDIQVVEDFNSEILEVNDEEEMIGKYLNLFDKEDKHFAMEYLKVVKNHFEWTSVQAITELMKDTLKLFDRFHVWKGKFKKTEQE